MNKIPARLLFLALMSAILSIHVASLGQAEGRKITIKPFPEAFKKSAPSDAQSQNNAALKGHRANAKKQQATNPLNDINDDAPVTDDVRNEAQRMETLERLTRSLDGPGKKPNSPATISKNAAQKAMTTEELSQKYNKGLAAQNPQKQNGLKSKRVSVSPAAIKEEHQRAATPEVNQTAPSRRTIPVVNAPPSSPKPMDARWQALKDASLLDTLDGWSRKEDILLVWNTPASYFIPRTLLINKSYPKAVEELLEIFSDVPFRPVGQLYWDEDGARHILVIQSLDN